MLAVPFNQLSTGLPGLGVHQHHGSVDGSVRIGKRLILPQRNLGINACS